MRITDEVLDWSALIRSNGELNLRLAAVSSRNGVPSLGLIVVPGSYKLAIVSIGPGPQPGLLEIKHYKDPDDPCFYDALETATPEMVEAYIGFSNQQIRAALADRPQH